MKTNSPTEKQIILAERMANMLNIEFPVSSKDFNKATYCMFIKDHYDEWKDYMLDDYCDYWDEELAWYQMLNGQE